MCSSFIVFLFSTTSISFEFRYSSSVCFSWIMCFSSFLQVKKLNVFLLGLAFMFVFTGFNTMSGIQTLIFNSATNQDSGGFVPGFQVGARETFFRKGWWFQTPNHAIVLQGNGFIASAVIYGVFSIASWMAPSVVAWRGPRWPFSLLETHSGCIVHTLPKGDFGSLQANIKQCQKSNMNFPISISNIFFVAGLPCSSPGFSTRNISASFFIQSKFASISYVCWVLMYLYIMYLRIYTNLSAPTCSTSLRPSSGWELRLSGRPRFLHLWFITISILYTFYVLQHVCKDTWSFI